MDLDIDIAIKEFAIKRFEELAGLSRDEAQNLVGFALQASMDDTLETIMGTGVVPTTLTMARVALLKSVCLSMHRPLSKLEIQILFRTTPSNAKAILTTMTATYAQPLHINFLLQMRSDAVVRSAGIEGQLTWIVKFGQEACYETARTEFQRDNLSRFVDCRVGLLEIEFKQGATAKTGGFDLLLVLGLTPPTKRKRRNL